MKVIAKKSLVWLWLSIFVISIDQLIKVLVVHNFDYGVPVKLTSFLNLLLTYNAGASFGFLKNEGGWQIYFFSAISIGVTILLAIWLAKTPRYLYWRAAGISLIIGGAIGNLIDRVTLAHVIDFVNFHIGAWNFAIFNFADGAVSVGAFFLILSLMFNRRADYNCT